MTITVKDTIFKIVQGTLRLAEVMQQDYLAVRTRLAADLRATPRYAPIIEQAAPSFSETFHPVIQENRLRFFNRTGTWRGEQPVDVVSLLPQFVTPHELVLLLAPIHSFPATLIRAFALAIGLAAFFAFLGYNIEGRGTALLVGLTLLVVMPIVRLMQYKKSVDERRYVASELQERAEIVDEVLFP